MKRGLILLPILLSACMAAETPPSEPFPAVEVSRAAEWSGCEAEGGMMQDGDSQLVCVVE